MGADQHLPPDLLKFAEPHETRVVYASRRFVSLFLADIWTGVDSASPFYARVGAPILDLERGVELRALPCRRRTQPIERTGDMSVRIAGLMEACDDRSVERLSAIARAHLARQTSALPPLDESRAIWGGPASVLYAFPTERGIALHVHEHTARFNKLENLIYDPYNPIIVPYRELKEFLLPGPFREEVLRLDRSQR
ncbi:MAG: hypothetical protein FJX02_14160 [Alphaproteobacteria bacterium]|nr:hypothetical protein [Alphaproteobacteria bacterium]